MMTTHQTIEKTKAEKMHRKTARVKFRLSLTNYPETAGRRKQKISAAIALDRYVNPSTPDSISGFLKRLRSILDLLGAQIALPTILVR
jgi:hypothetical protein